MIKPDAVSRWLAPVINERIKKAGLRIVAQRHLLLNQLQAEGFYGALKNKKFFGSLCAFMTSGPVVVQVLEGENAIARYRALMGETDPARAAPGTLRRDYAKNIEQNAVHGSDSTPSAAREIAFFSLRTP